MGVDSSITFHDNVTLNVVSDIIDRELEIVEIINIICLSGSIGLFGICTNVINLVVFFRQGLNTTINISFFALTVSDFCSLVCQEVFVIFAIPLFRNLGIPIVYADIQRMILLVPREGFVRYSSLVTFLITAERYICIVFPQTVQQIITPCRAAVILLCLCIGNSMPGVPVYMSCRFGWMFYPKRNRTLLGIIITNSNDIQERHMFIIHAVLLFFSVSTVVFSTIVLVIKLKETSAWRSSLNIQNKHLSKRDRRTMSMVVLIACTLIACYTPSVMLCIAMFCEPEFTRRGKYANTVFISWSFALVFETINSSVNIFIYVNMSSKYKRTLRSLLKTKIID